MSLWVCHSVLDWALCLVLESIITQDDIKLEQLRKEIQLSLFLEQETLLSLLSSAK